ncbi:scopoletin glucosyltransferase-like [Prunus avium]|uniref:Scopoletin glucosyltransferase-like n=1 Tax=Prunus avium TaxID=42229 RepID=A0A6P5TLU9_PRUAV|nr:scopoletin glucosyltransferase-like [Prunus avium]
MDNNFSKALGLLQEPLEWLLLADQPSCLVADMFFPWVTDAAAKFGIPRLVFHGTSFFALAASDCVKRYEPFKNMSSDSEPFVMPNLPGEIKMTGAQVPYFLKENIDNDLTQLMKPRKPFKNMSSDSEPFVMPNLPGEIKMTGAQVPYFLKANIDNDLTQLMKRAQESGIVVNSFYELEPVYANYHTKVLGRKAWHIGPLSLCNRDNE